MVQVYQPFTIHSYARKSTPPSVPSSWSKILLSKISPGFHPGFFSLTNFSLLYICLPAPSTSREYHFHRSTNCCVYASPLCWHWPSPDSVCLPCLHSSGKISSYCSYGYSHHTSFVSVGVNLIFYACKSRFAPIAFCIFLSSLSALSLLAASKIFLRSVSSK